MNKLSTRTTLIAFACSVAAISLAIATPKLFEDLDSGSVMVIQSPMSGDLSVHTEPGWKWQGFGSVTKYPRRNEFAFNSSASGCPALSASDDKRVASDDHVTAGLGIRFYDGGNATLCGSISWMMPLDPKSIIELHRDFRSAPAFELQAIRRSMESAATFSGPTMSSFDSAAGKRNELLQILNEQTLHGVYKTRSTTTRAKDVAGVEKDMVITEIVKDDKGVPLRAQDSYVRKYNVTMLPMTISYFRYEDRVEEQIKQQQAATNAAVVGMANTKKAEQEAITAEANGRALAVKAKWEQEVLNAKTIADAQAKILIADANVKEAEAFKKAETLRGEGEAARKQAVMNADGQLDKKLEALVTINKNYAEAIANASPGAWAPNIQMGSGSSGGDRATNLIDLLTAKTAKDLSVDLGLKGSAATKK